MEHTNDFLFIVAMMEGVKDPEKAVNDFIAECDEHYPGWPYTHHDVPDEEWVALFKDFLEEHP